MPFRWPAQRVPNSMWPWRSPILHRFGDGGGGGGPQIYMTTGNKLLGTYLVQIEGSTCRRDSIPYSNLISYLSKIHYRKLHCSSHESVLHLRQLLHFVFQLASSVLVSPLCINHHIKETSHMRCLAGTAAKLCPLT